MKKLIDLTGKIFGDWTVLSRAENNHKQSSLWRCRCVCGKERDVNSQPLRESKSLSCGCRSRNKKCTVPGCGKKHLANGYCRTHYLRMRKRGSLEVSILRGVSAVDRILAKSAKNESGCLIYTKKLTKKGYAHVRADCGRMRFAHVIMYEAKNGPVPSGMELDHLCRNRACCEPDHLEAVTHIINVQRGIAGHNWKNRSRVNGKFSKETALEKGLI